MNFIWSDFGVLDRCSYDQRGYLLVHNTDNDSRAMSTTYSSVFNPIEHKCQLLKGKSVQIRTSQNTGTWSPQDWFSDISLSGTEVNSSAPSKLSIENSDELHEKINNLIQERDQANARVGELFDRENELLDQVKEVTRQANLASFSEYFESQRADILEKKMVDLKSENVSMAMTIEKLLAGGETSYCEFKESLSLNVRNSEQKDFKPVKDKGIEKACLKNVIAFLNTDGGTILVGVEDENCTVSGTENEIKKLFKTKDDFRQYVDNLITHRIGEGFLPNIKISYPEIDHTEVLRINVKRSANTPAFLKPEEAFYTRVSASTRELKNKHLADYILARFK